jgi:hypothetical protein
MYIYQLSDPNNVDNIMPWSSLKRRSVLIWNEKNDLGD